MTWLRVGVVVMLGSVGIGVWSVLEALETDPLPDFVQGPEMGEVERTPRPTRTRVNIAAAVATDPFHPERRAPDEPYRFPGEIPQGRGSSGSSRSQQLRLIGTVASVSGGGFVFCQVGSQRPQLVHVGGQIGNYKLKTVEAGRAVFTDPSGNAIELTISQPTQGR
jgi:hypothetical protein